jgi:hypothetical protein
VDDLDGLRDIAQIQSTLQSDFDLIAHYGGEHPGDWAGAWFENEPTVRIVAAFTGDAAQHDAALRPRLQPGRQPLQVNESGEMRAFGFSPDGTTFVIATSPGIEIYRRKGEGR